MSNCSESQERVELRKKTIRPWTVFGFSLPRKRKVISELNSRQALFACFPAKKVFDDISIIFSLSSFFPVCWGSSLGPRESRQRGRPETARPGQLRAQDDSRRVREDGQLQHEGENFPNFFYFFFFHFILCCEERGRKSFVLCSLLARMTTVCSPEMYHFNFSAFSRALFGVFSLLVSPFLFCRFYFIFSLRRRVKKESGISRTRGSILRISFRRKCDSPLDSDFWAHSSPASFFLPLSHFSLVLVFLSRKCPFNPLLIWTHTSYKQPTHLHALQLLFDFMYLIRLFFFTWI